MSFVDIFSKADVVEHLRRLAKAGKVRECSHLRVARGHAGAFCAECKEDWARCIPADNVVTDDMACDAPSSYAWPACPADCPKFMETRNFVLSLTDVHVASPTTISTEHYVHPDRLRQLRACKSAQYDLTKLLRFCEEINICYQARLVLAIPMLVRAVLDHVPPVFSCGTFSELANNCSAGRSFKDAMSHLDKTSRKIADLILHTQVRKSEALPMETQVDFRNSLDMLLQEIVRVLK